MDIYTKSANIGLNKIEFWKHKNIKLKTVLQNKWAADNQRKNSVYSKEYHTIFK